MATGRSESTVVLSVLNGGFSSGPTASDRMKESIITTPMSDDTLSFDRMTEGQKRSTKIVRGVQYLSVLVSLGATIYFVQKAYIYVALQYTQVCFISVLTVVLDSSTYWIQRFWLVMSIFVALGWGAVTLWEGERYEDFRVYDYAIGSLSGLVFFGGMIFASYVCVESAPLGKRVELDLLLYLVSLNAICFFTSNHAFNTNLHMILDIRTMVLLFNGLLQPRDKMDLLRSVPFMSIMFLIIASFMISSTSHISFGTAISSIYVVIGAILAREAYVVHTQCNDRTCKNQRNHDSDIADAV